MLKYLEFCLKDLDNELNIYNIYNFHKTPWFRNFCEYNDFL